MFTILRTMSLPVAAVWSAVIVMAAGCAGGEPADPQAAAQPAEPVAPAGRAIQPKAPKPAKAPNTPLPAQPAADAVAPWRYERPHGDPIRSRSLYRFEPDLHHTQVVTAVGQMRDTMAPWRDTGANRLFSAHVFGTPFMPSSEDFPRPWLATGIASRESWAVWTIRLREDAVFQDGTPIMAADIKAYWEHGAKPGNAAAWGGASLILGSIRGWEALMAGEAAEAEGLRVIDAHTLEIETVVPSVWLPLHLAAWQVGISKLDQVLADENWGRAPIGAGPFSLTYDPGTGLTELTRIDLAGNHWTRVEWPGVYGDPYIWKLELPNIPDERVRLIMFESGELDLMKIDRSTFEAAHDPRHPFNPLVYISPAIGSLAIEPDIEASPLDDLLFRKALAHGQDMEKIVKIVWGSSAVHAKGLITSMALCHDPGANHQPYDPDLARQYLSESEHGSGDDGTSLTIDLSRPDMVELGIFMKRYWKHNLGVDLEIRGRGAGMPRRTAPHLRDVGLDSWVPDPGYMADRLILGRTWDEDDPWPVLAALHAYARSLPFDHPDRCEAFQAVEQEYVASALAIPITEVNAVRWVVQPWLIGFESTFNQDFNTLTTAYVAAH